eukprot:EG_transcript_23264
MFVLVHVRDNVKLPPASFGQDFHQAIKVEVNGRYTDRVLPGVGLCVLLYDLLKVGEAVVHPGDGAAWVKVEFREVVFRPFPNETLAGQVLKADQSGIQLSLGFFSEIRVPPHLMQQPSRFDEAQGLWVWCTEDEAGAQLELFIDLGAEVLFQVVEVQIDTQNWSQPPAPAPARDRHAPPAPTAAAPKEPEGRYPMRITASFKGDGLGVAQWWES